MVRLLVYLVELIVLALALRRVVQALFHLPGEPRLRVWHWGGGVNQPRDRRTVQGETARDPICGMFVSTELSQRLTLGERTLHFCSPQCLERYKKMNA